MGSADSQVRKFDSFFVKNLDRCFENPCTGKGVGATATHR